MWTLRNLVHKIKNRFTRRHTPLSYFEHQFEIINRDLNRQESKLQDSSNNIIALLGKFKTELQKFLPNQTNDYETNDYKTKRQEIQNVLLNSKRNIDHDSKQLKPFFEFEKGSVYEHAYEKLKNEHADLFKSNWSNVDDSSEWFDDYLLIATFPVYYIKIKKIVDPQFLITKMKFFENTKHLYNKTIKDLLSELEQFETNNKAIENYDKNNITDHENKVRLEYQKHLTHLFKLHNKILKKYSKLVSQYLKLIKIMITNNMQDNELYNEIKEQYKEKSEKLNDSGVLQSEYDKIILEYIESKKTVHKNLLNKQDITTELDEDITTKLDKDIRTKLDETFKSITDLTNRIEILRHIYNDDSSQRLSNDIQPKIPNESDKVIQRLTNKMDELVEEMRQSDNETPGTLGLSEAQSLYVDDMDDYMYGYGVNENKLGGTRRKKLNKQKTKNKRRKSKQKPKNNKKSKK